MHATTPSKRTRTEYEGESQRSASQFSTDLSQGDDHQQPVATKETWYHLQPRNKNEKKNTQRTNAKRQRINPEDNERKSSGALTNEKDELKMLNNVLSLVEPIPGAECAYRAAVRQLKKCISDRIQNQTRNCPVHCTGEVLEWASGAPDVCTMCGLNHNIVEVYRIGNLLCGQTAKIRKANVARWMREGSEEYHKKMREILEKSSLRKLLEEMTTRHKKPGKERKYVVQVIFVCSCNCI